MCSFEPNLKICFTTSLSSQTTSDRQFNNELNLNGRYGDFCRKIELYPKGKGDELGRYLSLYLVLANLETLYPGSKICAQTILRILDQKQAETQYGKGNVFSRFEMQFLKKVKKKKKNTSDTK